MKPIHIYLCRHGQSVGNTIAVDTIGQPTDSPLTDLGKQQAKLLGEKFLKDKRQFNQIFTSTFVRASQTTKIIIDTIDYKKHWYACNELVEYSPGDWRGKNRVEVFNNIDNLRKVAALNMGFKFPNGEALHQVERRAATWLEDTIIFNKDVLEVAEKETQHFLIVSHGMTIRCLLHYIMGFDQSFIWNINTDNAAITHLIFGERGWYLQDLNDKRHLA